MSTDVMAITDPADPSFEELLPLIGAYQRFYEVEPDEARNAAFFRRFLEPAASSATADAGDLAPDRAPGMLLGARVDGTGPLVGYACLHWRIDTVSATEVVCLHDLYAVAEVRGTGVGRALLEAAADIARARGAASLVWSTAPDNATAQRLYDATGAARSTWVEYELSL